MNQGDWQTVSVEEARQAFEDAVRQFQLGVNELLDKWNLLENVTEGKCPQPITDSAYRELWDCSLDEWVYSVNCLHPVGDGSFTIE